MAAASANAVRSSARLWLTAGSSVALSITATVLGSGSYANVAEVIAADQTDADSIPGDGTGDDHAVVVPVPIPIPTVDLALGMTVDDPTPSVGSSVTFTLSLSNGAG